MNERISVPAGFARGPTVASTLQTCRQALGHIDAELALLEALPAVTADVMRLKHAHQAARVRVLAAAARLYARVAPKMIEGAPKIADLIEAETAAALGEVATDNGGGA